MRAAENVRARGSSTSAAAGKKTERFWVALQPSRQRREADRGTPAQRLVQLTRVDAAPSLEEALADLAGGLRVEHVRRAVVAIRLRHAGDDVPCEDIVPQRRQPEVCTHDIDLSEQRRRRGARRRSVTTGENGHDGRRHCHDVSPAKRH